MTEALDIVDRLFERDGPRLAVGGVPVDRLAREFGTPLFVYDRSVIESRLRRLRAALPRLFEVYYSIKANPARGVLKVFLEADCGLEVASSGELDRAISAGCEPGRIVFAGPGKTSDELEHAARVGVGEIHVESHSEIDRLSEISARLGVATPVAVRINPVAQAQGGAMRMGGKPSPFGFDEEMLEAVVDRVEAAGSLEMTGIHLFTGTQILDHRILLGQYAKALEIAVRVAERIGRPVRTVDFGGGLGIPYHTGDSELDLESFGASLAPLFERESSRPELRGTRFIVEPGRYLVGESGVYVVSVTCVKRSRGKTFVVVDGGMHHHLAASGNLGQVIKRNFPVAVLGKLGVGASGKVDVVGPLCTPLDVLARDVELPAVEEGDLVGVFQSGAYGRSASPLGFLSHAEPPEVVVEGGRATLSTARGATGR